MSTIYMLLYNIFTYVFSSGILILLKLVYVMNLQYLVISKTILNVIVFHSTLPTNQRK